MSGWEQYAACATVGGGMWDDGSSEQAEARHICWHTCAVREACLDAALDEERGQAIELRGGIRGGLSPRERLLHEQTTGAAA